MTIDEWVDIVGENYKIHAFSCNGIISCCDCPHFNGGAKTFAARCKFQTHKDLQYYYDRCVLARKLDLI